ncbi:hypothetical protein [Microbacterium sp.]|uniref:hypothetical protein n=1 Tax=Microbacterium sp. TaxID=51671 RepID=UPI0037CCBD5B
MNRFLQLLAFLVIPGLSAATPLIAIPAITATAGAPGWEAYALGLSIGSAGGVIVELGWSLMGPQRVAAEAPGRRWVTLVSSVRTRLIALVVVAPVATVVAMLLAGNARSEHVATAGLMALACVAVGLSGSWYFVGTGHPLRILASEALPRTLLIIVASVAVVAGAPLVVIPASYLLAAIFSPAASLLLARRDREFAARFTLRQDFGVIREQFAAVGVRSIAALYMALPIALVGAFAPAALAMFAAAERLMRMGLTLLQAVPNVLQNWLGSARSRDERRERATRSILLCGGLGIVAGAVFTVATPVVTPLLFTGTVSVPWHVAALGGVVVFLVCVSRATGGLALVAYRRVPWLTLSTAVAAVVGLPAICLLAVVAGAPGAFLGEILAELTAITVQLWGLRSAIRAERTEDDPS